MKNLNLNEPDFYDNTLHKAIDNWQEILLTILFIWFIYLWIKNEGRISNLP